MGSSMSKSIMHICNNYIASKVNFNLVNQLRREYSQIVIIPYREKKLLNKNKIHDKNIDYEYIYFNNSFIRFFPFFKALFITLKIHSKIKNKSWNTIIAHTLWSDGFCAFVLSKIYPASYSVVVRNTDINFFLPKLPHYRWLIKKIISSSSNLIFLSKAYEKRFIEKYPSLYNAAKCITIIPNGIDSFWIDNVSTENKKRKEQICFVGSFTENKNINAIYKASLLAKCKVIDLELVLIGGTEQQLKKLLGITTVPDWIKVLGFINKKSKILNVYRESRLFIMPSFTESFGLVYLEAFSQGCSIICSKGEGIDGFFNSEAFFISVDPNNDIEISDSIITLLSSYPTGVDSGIVLPYLDAVKWEEVAALYTEKLI